MAPERLWIICTYAFWILLVAWPAGGRAKHIRYEHQLSGYCVYNNSTYRGGSQFRPDPCTVCHCPRRGGRADCVIEDCIHDPDCVRYVPNPESFCCDVCVQRGCRDSDGLLYKPGQIVSTVSCTVCKCPPGGGRIECSHVKCPQAPCVDAVYDKNKCCLICPNGPNCWLGNEILEAGKVIRRNQCKTCRCPEKTLPRWLDRKGPRAVCTITDC